MLRFLHGKLAQDNLPKRIIWLLRGLYSCMVLRVNDGGLLKKNAKISNADFQDTRSSFGRMAPLNLPNCILWLLRA